jgi:peptide/nickel transport system substrate-binding protein
MFVTHLRRLSATVVASVAAVALLAACSSTEDGSPSANEPAAAAPDISIAAVSGPNSLDPAQLVQGTQMYVWGSIYDTLLARDNKTGELIPNAAESWEYNEDGTKLTLVLREGMTFSNGEAVTADAVAATMLRTKETPGILQPVFASVTGAIAEDERTVVVEFSAYDPQFVWFLPLGAGAIAEPSTFDDPAIATDPVGSGPYTLDTEKTVAGTMYVLDKREDYWNADAYPYPTATIRVMQDPTASFNALQSGEVNAATVQPQMAGQLGTGDFTVTDVPATALVYLNILDRAGEKWPALGDVRVRKAINMALDREGMITGIYAGNGTAATQIFNPNGQVFDAELEGAYPFDVAEAKKLVDEAGAAGTVFQIPSTYLTTQIEPTLSQAFADIGLGLEWVAVPPQQQQSSVTSGEFGLAVQIAGYNSDAADAFYHFGPNTTQNPRKYSDATTEAIFAEIHSTVDAEAALPAYRELNAYAVEQAFEVPIVYVDTKWATTDGIEMAGYGGAPPTLRTFAFAG